MASTVEIEVTDTEWTQIAIGASTLAIQLVTQGQIDFYIGDTAPDELSAGLVIASSLETVPTTISAASVPDTAQVFVRSGIEKPVKIVVMSY